MRPAQDIIEIKLSKVKILLLLIGATLFVIFGVLFTINPDQFQSIIFSNVEAIRVVGIASVAFFGLCLVLILIKLFDNKAGLIIDPSGITDNSNTTSIGLIEWGDIIGIRTIRVFSTKMIMLQVENPEKYIERAKSGIFKRTMKVNYKMYGSPISITSSSLKVKFEDLEKLMLKEFEKRRA